jgi:hypothetical protein
MLERAANTHFGVTGNRFVPIRRYASVLIHE